MSPTCPFGYFESWGIARPWYGRTIAFDSARTSLRKAQFSDTGQTQ
jgi:hypothetical protein